MDKPQLAEVITYDLYLSKSTPHKRVYRTDDPDAPIETVYVKKETFSKHSPPETITLTITFTE